MIKIPLNHSQFAIIDDYELYKVQNYKWNTQPGPEYKKHKYGYVRSEINGKIVSMHKVIVGYAPNGFVVDHINGNKLDNRLSNLRFATYSENMCNATKENSNKKYRGVSTKSKSSHTAGISYKGKYYYWVLLKPKSRLLWLITKKP